MVHKGLRLLGVRRKKNNGRRGFLLQAVWKDQSREADVIRTIVLAWLDLGPFWGTCWHPDGKGKGMRAFQARGQYVEPLGEGNEPSLGRRERGSWLGWGGDVCRVS